MTQQEWDEKWWANYNYLIQRAGITPNRAFEQSHAHMLKVHGPRPKGESSGPPFWLKLLALSLGVKMSPLLTRILTSVFYAVTATVAAYQAAAQPITVEGYIGLGVAFLVAFWGKFSSSTTSFAANRNSETFTGAKAGTAATK